MIEYYPAKQCRAEPLALHGIVYTDFFDTHPLYFNPAYLAVFC
jgi:hypothetical protein